MRQASRRRMRKDRRRDGFAEASRKVRTKNECGNVSMRSDSIAQKIANMVVIAIACRASEH